MKKKRSDIRPLPLLVPSSRPVNEHWHNGAEIEIGLYARSLHKSAKLLLEKLDRRGNPKAAWDVGPIITLYRHAIDIRFAGWPR